MKLLKKLIDVLASYGFACVCLILLFVLTLFGTFEQVDHGLYDVQKKYFESLWLVHDIGPVPLPLPGATLVMAALSLNLLLGGLVRIRKSWATAGVIVVHVGIALLLAAGLVKMTLSEDGYLTLFEGQRSNEFVSYYDWEVAIFDAEKIADVTEFIVPDDDFQQLTGGRSAWYRSPDLPFDVKLSSYVRNCEVLPKGPMWSTDYPVIDGYAVMERKPDVEAERNVAAIFIDVRGDDGAEQKGLLWGVERYPWTFSAGGKTWAATLRKRRFPMPYTIHLENFTRELHPGTNMPAAFESDVVKLENGSEQRINISMNDPLRDGGLILFQSGWGPQDAPPGTPLFSTFSVVRNPSDQWPTISCIVIAVGLLIAFGRKLFLYVKKQTDTRKAALEA